MLDNNRLEKVFFAIRTDFFGFPDEHMTVKYFREVGFETLLLNAQILERHMPVHIELDRPSHWASHTEDKMFQGYLIKHNNNNPLYPPMPHITYPNNITYEPPTKYDEVYDTLYLGKRDRTKGVINWIPVNTEQFSNTGVIGI